MSRNNPYKFVIYLIRRQTQIKLKSTTCKLSVKWNPGTKHDKVIVQKINDRIKDKPREKVLIYRLFSGPKSTKRGRKRSEHPSKQHPHNAFWTIAKIP